MVPIHPHRIEKGSSGGARLVVRVKNTDKYFVVRIKMEQARLLAADMHGLADDLSSHHHTTASLAQALNADIVGIILKDTGNGAVHGVMRIQEKYDVVDAEVDVAAGVSLAIHLGLPLYMDSSFMSKVKRSANATDDSVPSAFREVIESLETWLPEET